MTREEQDEMRHDMLVEQRHEERMSKDTEYFCTYTIENWIPDTRLYLFDTVIQLKKHCIHYNQEFSDLCSHMDSM